MSTTGDPPVLIVRGRYPPLVVALALSATFALTFAGVIASAVVFHKLGDTPRLIEAKAGVAVLSVASPFVALLAVIVVFLFFSKRAGAVAFHEGRVTWSTAGGETIIRRWDALEGFRDTPNPWVALVEKGGFEREVPVRSELEREQVLALLRNKLPDLSETPAT